MKTLSKNAIIGYPAGIITGITYGLNPLFAVPLMNNGAAIESILFFRYSFAVVLLGAFLILTKQSFRMLEKPLAFAPRGRVALTPSGEIVLTLLGEIKMTPEKHTFFRGFL